MDDFRLAYDDHPGDGDAVVLLHGWPGDRHDYRAVVPLLEGRRIIVPDLRGFGETTGPAEAEAVEFGVDGQGASVIALIEEVVGGPVVLGGYDVGSRTSQGIARMRPDLVRGLVISPPVPGVGRRILEPDPQQEFWYQSFHRLELAERLLDGSPRRSALTSSTSGRTGRVPTTRPSPRSSTASPPPTAVRAVSSAR